MLRCQTTGLNYVILPSAVSPGAKEARQANEKDEAEKCKRAEWERTGAGIYVRPQTKTPWRTWQANKITINPEESGREGVSGASARG